MKKTYLLILTALLMGAYSCKKSEPEQPNNPNNQTPKPPQRQTLELISNIWILDQTFKNGAQETSNGTGEYEYTRDGKFKFFSSGTWHEIGRYQFADSDSSYVNMVFTGTTNAIKMKIIKLDANNLHTEFRTGSNDFVYNYKR
jgi:hypothetical protein